MPDLVAFPSKPAQPDHPQLQSRFNTRISRARTLSLSAQHAVKVVAAPVNYKLVLLCVAWYFSSAISSNISKSILQVFQYPVSLTMIQFVFSAFFSSAAVSLASKSPKFASNFPPHCISTEGLPEADKLVFICVGPMAIFQILGHIFSHSATSQIPVSLVHAIKSLSPMLTVMAYSLIFKTRYKLSTYLSLIPLTLGVIMACSAEFKAKPLALIYAFLSCVIFVTQNIWSKRLLTTGSTGSTGGGTQEERKLDKVSIIFWCAVVGFAGTFPIWLFSDGKSLMRIGTFVLKNETSSVYLLLLLAMNGFSHFCQNLLSFMILGSISPVSYSIASLLKRVFVMTVAILWFGQRVNKTQGYGILLTFLGLYLYDRFGTKHQNKQSQLVLPK